MLRTLNRKKSSPSSLAAWFHVPWNLYIFIIFLWTILIQHRLIAPHSLIRQHQWWIQSELIEGLHSSFYRSTKLEILQFHSVPARIPIPYRDPEMDFDRGIECGINISNSISSIIPHSPFQYIDCRKKYQLITGASTRHVFISRYSECTPVSGNSHVHFSNIGWKFESNARWSSFPYHWK